MLSSRRNSGSARRKSSSRPGFLFAIAIPAGLRCQTPISYTASKPKAAMASHSAAGTEPRSTGLPAFLLSSESHTHVLISYTVGYRGQLDMSVPPEIARTAHRLNEQCRDSRYGRYAFTVMGAISLKANAVQLAA